MSGLLEATIGAILAVIVGAVLLATNVAMIALAGWGIFIFGGLLFAVIIFAVFANR